jgi:dsDNA-binding SOS-regulon protein
MNLAYWHETVEEIFYQENIDVSEEKLESIAEYIATSHDMYSTYTGQEHIPSPLATKNDRLEKELKKEKSKIGCSKWIKFHS